MKSFYLLDNPIRDYAWGHPRDIPEFLEIDYPVGKPAAELWMGAHPGAPSMVVGDSGNRISLQELIDGNPEAALGSEVAGRYGRLPFLFKLLAAGKSLSIQAHPDKLSAQEGFERENRAGVPLDSPVRNYRDDNHKPEIMMALTTFTAMIGFRSPTHICRRFDALQRKAGVELLEGVLLRKLADGVEAALRDFLDALLNADAAAVSALLSAAEDGNGTNSGWDRLEAEWVPRLLGQFPGDAGALAPLFLNVVELKPGQALYQPARALHAYLSGFGVELMANSDNVLRGGLTPKNVDVPELLKNLDFRQTVPDVLEAADTGNGVKRYGIPAEEFDLSLSESDGRGETPVPESQSPRIAMVLEGELVLSDGRDEQPLKRGMSVFIPAGAANLGLTGAGRMAWAGVPTSGVPA